MDRILDEFKLAYVRRDGNALARVFTPEAPADDPGRLYSFHRNTNAVMVGNQLRSQFYHSNEIAIEKSEGDAWMEVFEISWHAVGELLLTEENINRGRAKEANWDKTYKAWKKVTDALIRNFQNLVFPYWAVPCLYVGAKYLRILALKADDASRQKTSSFTFDATISDEIVDASSKNECLEDAARQINRMFSVCYADRAPVEESRKWALYYVTNTLFKIYFKNNSIGLAKNLIRSLTATEMPPLERFPASHQVTFNYYSGVIAFLEENYELAEEYLLKSWARCHPAAQKNRELILTYLIPCHLVTKQEIPTAAMLTPYPHLASVFLPLSTAIKRASLAGFDAALHAGESYFVKRRIYLTLERARDIVVRNLFRKVFVAGGFMPLKDGEDEQAPRARRSRIPLAEFLAAARLSSRSGAAAAETIDRDEVECLLANMIYKNFMKGYIARDAGIVVLSRTNAFPGTGL